MLYVDQPVGTGFSFTDHPDDYDDNEDQISQHLYEFLQEFYVKFPQYKKLDFFIAGVSYAGHFVPALGNRIFQALKNKEGPFDIPLKGFAIGNGLTNAYIQYMDYANYSFDKGLIDEKTRNYIQNSLLPVCEQAILQNKTDEQTDDCNAIFETIQEKALRDFNTYDVRDPCVNKPLCYDFSKLGDLMTNANFRSAIGVSPNGHYSECDTTVYSKLASIDWWQNCDKYIPELLEAGIRVLVYNG
jgi:serine carboxypeptidase-like clade 4